MPPNLVVIDEIEILQCRDDIFFLDTGDFTDLTAGGQRLSPLRIFICPQDQTGSTMHPQGGRLGSLDGDLWPLPTLRLQPHQDLQDGLRPVTSVG